MTKTYTFLKPIRVLIIKLIWQFKLVLFGLFKNPLMEPIAKIIFKNKIEKATFESGLESINSEIILKNSVPLIYSKPIFNVSEFDYNNDIQTINNQDQYVSIIKNSCVIGGSNLIITNASKAIYDLKFLDIENKLKYTDEGKIYGTNDFCLINAKCDTKAFDKAILMSGNYSWNYYHYLMEILVKFQNIELLKLDKTIPLLVDEISLKIPQFKELLNLFNTNNHPLIPLSKGIRYKIEEVYYISTPNFIPTNFLNPKLIKGQDVLIDSSSIDYIRSKLIPHVKAGKFPKKIFITRANASNRRKYNEEEVLLMLKQHGFIVVHPENYSVVDQISMFQNADFIIGGSGAAFTNIIFCRSSCKIICLANYKLELSIFSTIASYLQITLLYITDNTKNIDTMNDIHDSFKINVDALESVIKKWSNI